MLISYKWLQKYFDSDLPSPEKLADLLSLHAFEVEGIERVGEDIVIDVDVLPNRSHDALSHDGMAREVGVLLDRAVDFPVDTVDSFADEKTADAVELSVENERHVPRATKRLFENVSVGESPEWLKERLKVLGQRSINNVVDITNVVMFETGQPIHAFDFDKIAGEGKKNITIRGAKEGETVATLDGAEWELEEGMLVIADSERALDIAGVKGGADSGVDKNTTRVLLSACNFDPSLIRKTSRALGLITDASKRFGQGITPALIDRAHERAAHYLSELAGAKPTEDIVDLYPHPRKPYKAGVSLTEINNKLGTTLSSKEVENIFARLHFDHEIVLNPRESVSRLATTFGNVPYKYGSSVSRDCPHSFDCGSFINYLYVQFGISLPRMVQDQYAFTEHVKKDEACPGDIVFSSTGSDGDIEEVETLGIKQIRKTKQTLEFMPGLTFEESIDHAGIYLGDGIAVHASPKKEEGKVIIEKLSESNSFKKIVGFGRVIGSDDERFVVTIPPERLDLMQRGSILVSGNSEDLIEEVGRVYGYFNIEAQELPQAEKKSVVNKEVYYANKIRDLLVAGGFSEVMTYSLVNDGDVELANPFASDKSHLRTTLKDGVVRALEVGEKNKPLLGTDRVKAFEIGTVFTNGGEHTALAVGVGGKKAVGILEETQKTLAEVLGDVTVAKGADSVLEINNVSEAIEKLPEPSGYDFEEIDSSDVTYQTPSAFPFVLRDIALWCPQQVESEEVSKVIKEIAGALLTRIDLFDRFEKDNRVSYAFHLVFQSDEKTLTDEEVNPIMSNVEQMAKENNWEVR